MPSADAPPSNTNSSTNGASTSTCWPHTGCTASSPASCREPRPEQLTTSSASISPRLVTTRCWIEPPRVWTRPASLAQVGQACRRMAARPRSRTRTRAATARRPAAHSYLGTSATQGGKPGPSSGAASSRPRHQPHAGRWIARLASGTPPVGNTVPRPGCARRRSRTPGPPSPQATAETVPAGAPAVSTATSRAGLEQRHRAGQPAHPGARHDDLHVRHATPAHPGASAASRRDIA